MSLTVIEINDAALQARDTGGAVTTSPGFALLLQDGEVTLGAEAEAQHRLYPTSSYDKFWHELNMEPLPIPGRIRHHADLAYSQLVALAEDAGIDGRVIFAIPGHFSNEQLGLLLGIAGQCHFQVIGMIDAALAAAVGEAPVGSVVHVGLHLHQVLLTRVLPRDGELVVDAVIQVPQAGRQQLLDALMQTANDAFIRQCRFNPLHEAASEQQLYSLLADWAEGRAGDQQNLAMELKANAMTHTAKLPCDQLLAALQKPFRALLGSLEPLLERPGTGILLDHRLARWPGAFTALAEVVQLRTARPEVVAETCLRFRELITAGDGVRRIRALPLSDSAPEHPRPKPAATPTHVLFRNRALPVDDLPLVNKSNGSAG
ncbi:MAG: hypothetical protein F4121_02370, partial [Acidimicrobiia bacterium]|nr:hypothetical protein [Acidimicrobiia bacterium]